MSMKKYLWHGHNQARQLFQGEGDTEAECYNAAPLAGAATCHIKLNPAWARVNDQPAFFRMSKEDQDAAGGPIPRKETVDLAELVIAGYSAWLASWPATAPETEPVFITQARGIVAKK